MSAHEINVALQISCISLLGLGTVLLIKYAKTGMNTWTGIALTFCVICYLILETKVVQQTRPLFIIALTGSISIPVIFFLLTTAIFDDHFKPSLLIVVWFALEIIPHSWIYLKGLVSFGCTTQQVLSIISGVVSIGFVLASLYTAIKTRKGDLIESRLRFRNIFITVTAALIGVTLIVESFPIAKQSVDILQILQRSSMLGLTIFFLISNFGIRTGFFFRELQKEKPIAVEDSQLKRKLEALIAEKNIYKKEGLTIGELAKIMEEQEYKVRRLINGELGFRNFNDFLNNYRVNEACEILSDPSQNRKTILEIAYSLGYQSIGPFNKAFREIKDTTPTAYRKQAQS